MSDSRTAILARLRAASHPAPAPVAPWRPAATGLTDAFEARLHAVFGTSERLDSPSEIPLAITRYLTARSLPLEAAITPEFTSLDWQKAGISPLPTPSKSSVSTAVARAEAASAETGTLLLSSRDVAGPWPNLLADTYIAILEKSAISATFEDAVTRRAGNRMPRSLHAVTGPSRTGDIEQTLELGAHGAVRVHVLLLP
ncbi:MAG: LUD domain-containing protein [Micropepsaceae bacterium]